MKKFMLIATLILLPTQAQSMLAGNNLVDYMNEDEKFTANLPNAHIWKSGRYSGFVLGISDAYESAGVICFSSSVTNGQIYAVVSKFLKDNPDKWNYSAADLVVHSLKASFPCKK